MRKPQFSNNYIYHIFNRGVDKRTIFMDDGDHFRFVHQLYEFNNEDRVQNVKYYFNPKTMSVDSQPVKRTVSERKKLVDILVFTLMPNHFHLMIRQRAENGIVKFMQKLGTGYTMYFNKKYERTGSLLQGRFKAVMLSRRDHFLYLPYYIHTNPLSLKYGGSTSIFYPTFAFQYPPPTNLPREVPNHFHGILVINTRCKGVLQYAPIIKPLSCLTYCFKTCYG